MGRFTQGSSFLATIGLWGTISSRLKAADWVGSGSAAPDGAWLDYLTSLPSTKVLGYFRCRAAARPPMTKADLTRGKFVVEFGRSVRGGKTKRFDRFPCVGGGVRSLTIYQKWSDGVVESWVFRTAGCRAGGRRSDRVRWKMDRRSGIGGWLAENMVVLNYTHLHGFTRFYTKFLMGIHHGDTVLRVNHKLRAAGRELEARRRPAAGGSGPALLVSGIESRSVFKHAKDQMGEQPHGRADNDHFGFAFLGQPDGQSLDSWVAPQGGDGGKVQGLTQTAVAQFAHPGTAGERARLALTGRDAGEGRQLAGVVQLIKLRDNGQDGGGGYGAHAGNGGEQGRRLFEGGMGLEHLLNLPGQSAELAVQQPDLRPEVFGRGGGSAFQMLLGHHAAFQHLLPDAHQRLKLCLGGCGRLPGAGLVLLGEMSDEGGVVGVGFITAHPGAGKEVDGHGIDDTDYQALPVEIMGDGQSVSAGGFQADPWLDRETGEPAGQGKEAFGRVDEGGGMGASRQEQGDIELEFGDIDAKLRGVGIHIDLGPTDVHGTILVHTACRLRRRWPQLRYSPVLGRLLMGAEADLRDRISSPQAQNSLSAPAPVVVFPSANHKRGWETTYKSRRHRVRQWNDRQGNKAVSGTQTAATGTGRAPRKQ